MLDFKDKKNSCGYTADYRGYIIHADVDQYPENPFVDWDIEPGLIYQSYHYGRISTTDYADLHDKILSELTVDIVQANLKICTDLLREIVCDVDIKEQIRYAREYNPELTRADLRLLISEDIHDSITDEISNTDADYFEYLSVLCDLLKIPYINTVSTGYCQGDSLDVFCALTPGFFTRTGCSPDNSDEILQGTIDLFNAYMWGDVYIYSIEKNDEIIESCSGYYGPDLEKSGLAQAAIECVDYAIRARDLKRLNKLKQLIRARTPLFLRGPILGAIE